jgi:hypothetical protein
MPFLILSKLLRIDPGPFKLVFQSLPTAISDFLKSDSILNPRLAHVLESTFLLFPCMGQDGEGRQILVAHEVVDHERSCIDESHLWNEPIAFAGCSKSNSSYTKTIFYQIQAKAGSVHFHGV